MNPFSPETFFSLQRFAHRSLWKEGDSVWGALLALEEYLKGFAFQIEIKVQEGVYLQNRGLIAIGRGTIIEPGVMIEGPCVIGKGCIIRHGAYLRRGVVLGDHCVVGHAAELKGSILLDTACATHFVYVGDSILGNGVNLGAGVKCANLRLDRSEVVVKGVRTGLKKFGAIVGDRVQVGCNSVLNPGTLVGKGTVCHPLTNLRGVIPAESEVRMVQETLIGKQHV